MNNAQLEAITMTVKVLAASNKDFGKNKIIKEIKKASDETFDATFIKGKAFPLLGGGTMSYETMKKSTAQLIIAIAYVLSEKKTQKGGMEVQIVDGDVDALGTRIRTRSPRISKFMIFCIVSIILIARGFHLLSSVVESMEIPIVDNKPTTGTEVSVIKESDVAVFRDATMWDAVTHTQNVIDGAHDQLAIAIEQQLQRGIDILTLNVKEGAKQAMTDFKRRTARNFNTNRPLSTIMNFEDGNTIQRIQNDIVNIGVRETKRMTKQAIRDWEHHIDTFTREGEENFTRIARDLEDAVKLIWRGIYLLCFIIALKYTPRVNEGEIVPYQQRDHRRGGKRKKTKKRRKKRRCRHKTRRKRRKRRKTRRKRHRKRR